MPPMRLIVLLSLLCAHAALIAFGDALPEVVAPAIAGSIYLPLWALQSLGLPMFGPAQSGGWSGPCILGWALVAAVWTALWRVLVTAIARLRA